VFFFFLSIGIDFNFDDKKGAITEILLSNVFHVSIS